LYLPVFKLKAWTETNEQHAACNVLHYRSWRAAAAAAATQLGVILLGPELVMGWVYPWVGSDFLIFGGLGWMET